MSVAIRESLGKLNNAVQRLEKSVVSAETRSKSAARAAKSSPQNDLFAAPSAPSNVNNLNVRQLAARLDTAIMQVETILKEGRA